MISFPFKLLTLYRRTEEKKRLTTFHLKFTFLCVVRIHSKVHGTGECQRKPVKCQRDKCFSIEEIKFSLLSKLGELALENFWIPKNRIREKYCIIFIRLLDHVQNMFVLIKPKIVIWYCHRLESDLLGILEKRIRSPHLLEPAYF